MQQILFAVLMVGITLGSTLFASRAMLSNQQTSTDNTIGMGTVDLKIDFSGYYNKEADGNPNAGFWTLKNLTTEKFFNFSDVKPGDFGEGTFSLHVTTNDSWACMMIKNLHNNENEIIDPEIKEGDITVDPEGGELASNLFLTAWLDK